MNEEEYIQLNHLLTKYRVVLLKAFLADDPERTSITKQIRSVDNLRANMILNLEVDNEPVRNRETN